MHIDEFRRPLKHYGREKKKIHLHNYRLPLSFRSQFQHFLLNDLDFFITYTLIKYLYKIELFTQLMGRKIVSIDVKKNVILLRDIGISQHKISRQLKISRRCIRQTTRKFDRYGTVATRPGAGCPKKTTNQQTRLIKLEQIRDEINSLTHLVRYTNMNMSLSISTSTISRILRQYNITSYIVPRKPRITPKQPRARIDWCNEHLSWSVLDWSKVIFSDESNYEVLN